MGRRSFIRIKTRFSDMVKRNLGLYSSEEQHFMAFEDLLLEEANNQSEVGSELHRDLIQYMMENDIPENIPNLKEALRYGRSTNTEFHSDLSLHLQCCWLKILTSQFGEITIDHDRFILRHRGALMFNGMDRIYALGLLLDGRNLEAMKYRA